MSLFSRSIKNTVYNTLGFVWPILLNLAFTPYIVKNLGTDAYGIMGLTTILWGYFAFLDMGLGSGNIKYVSEYFATRKFEKINSVINTLLIFYILLGILGLMTLYFLSEYLSKTFFNIPEEYIGISIFAFQLSAFGFFVSILKPVFDGIPKALNRFDILNKINIIFGTLSTLLVVFVLFFGFGLKEVLIVKLTVNIIILAVGVIIAKKLLPFYKFNFRLEKSIFKMLFSYGFWEIFIKLANLAISTLGRLIISIMLGPAALTYYLIPQNLTTRINSFNYKMAEIIFPISSELSSTNSNERLNSIYLRMSKYSLAFKLSIYIPIIFYSYEILYFWLGKDFAEKGWLVMVFLAMGFFLNSLGHLPGLVTYGMAKLKITSFYTTINFLVLIITIYPCIKLFGIMGAGLSYFLSTLIFIYFLFHVNKKILNINAKEFTLKTIIKPLIVALIISLLCLFTKSLIQNLFVLVIFLITMFILYNVLAYLANIYDKGDVQKVLNIYKGAQNLDRKSRKYR